MSHFKRRMGVGTRRHSQYEKSNRYHIISLFRDIIRVANILRDEEQLDSILIDHVVAAKTQEAAGIQAGYLEME